MHAVKMIWLKLHSNPCVVRKPRHLLIHHGPDLWSICHGMIQRTFLCSIQFFFSLEQQVRSYEVFYVDGGEVARHSTKLRKHSVMRAIEGVKIIT